MGYRPPELEEKVPGTGLSLLHNHPAFEFVSNEEAMKHSSRAALVRSPLSRAESMAKMTGWPAEEFVHVVCSQQDHETNIHFQSQYWLLSTHDDGRCLNHLVPNRVFNLEHEYTEFFDYLQDLDLVYPDSQGVSLNVSTRKIEFSNAEKALLRQRYAKDYLAFGGEE